MDSCELLVEDEMARDAARTADPRGFVVGRLLGLVGDGRVPLVTFPGRSDTALQARSILDLNAAHIGLSVVLMFENADPAQPIVLGVIRDVPTANPASLATLEVCVDGGRVVLSSETELVLRCGKSRLTLRQDGKVEVLGETIVTRAAGANKVQGGSVQLN